jgi:tetratricopeptide (TPR) repeat protein
MRNFRTLALWVSVVGMNGFVYADQFQSDDAAMSYISGGSVSCGSAQWKHANELKTNGKFKKAAAEYIAAEASNPKLLPFELANLLSLTGQKAKAITAYREALKTNSLDYVPLSEFDTDSAFTEARDAMKHEQDLQSIVAGGEILLVCTLAIVSGIRNGTGLETLLI